MRAMCNFAFLSSFLNEEEEEEKTRKERAEKKYERTS